MKDIQYPAYRATTDPSSAPGLRAAFNRPIGAIAAELALSEASCWPGVGPGGLQHHRADLPLPAYEGDSKDYEFSRQTMEAIGAPGYRDARRPSPTPKP